MAKMSGCVNSSPLDGTDWVTISLGCHFITCHAYNGMIWVGYQDCLIRSIMCHYWNLVCDARKSNLLPFCPFLFLFLNVVVAVVMSCC